MTSALGLGWVEKWLSVGL